MTHVTRFADNERNIPLDFRQSIGRGRKREEKNNTEWRFERIVIANGDGDGRDEVSGKKRERRVLSIMDG